MGGSSFPSLPKRSPSSGRRSELLERRHKMWSGVEWSSSQEPHSPGINPNTELLSADPSLTLINAQSVRHWQNEGCFVHSSVRSFRKFLSSRFSRPHCAIIVPQLATGKHLRRIHGMENLERPHDTTERLGESAACWSKKILLR